MEKIKIHFKKKLLLLALISLGLISNAQKSSLSVSPIIGLTMPILESGIGFHIGINPAFSLSPRLSVEGQISYSYTNISSSFLSGNQGSDNSILSLIGGRLYLNSEEKTVRFYLSYLLGGMYRIEEINGIKNEGEFGIGFSGGFFLEWNKFLAGISGDTSDNIVLKIGYVF